MAPHGLSPLPWRNPMKLVAVVQPAQEWLITPMVPRHAYAGVHELSGGKCCIRLAVCHILYTRPSFFSTLSQPPFRLTPQIQIEYRLDYIDRVSLHAYIVFPAFLAYLKSHARKHKVGELFMNPMRMKSTRVHHGITT